jgi:hypothetical protein
LQLGLICASDPMLYSLLKWVENSYDPLNSDWITSFACAMELIKSTLSDDRDLMNVSLAFLINSHLTGLEMALQ